MNNKLLKLAIASLICLPALSSCSDDNLNGNLGDLEEGNSEFGKGNDTFSAEEWYSGGVLGTTKNASYSASAPAVENVAGMDESFKKGEDFFEHAYTITENLGLETVVLHATHHTVMVNVKTVITPTLSATAIVSLSTTLLQVLMLSAIHTLQTATSPK